MDLFDHLPTETGIYKFYHNTRLLYIGKAVNIKNRVRNHYDNHQKLMSSIRNIDKALKSNTESIGVQLIMMQILEAQRIDLDMDLVDDLGCLVVAREDVSTLEKEMISTLKPPYNAETASGNEPCDILKQKAEQLQRKIAGSFWSKLN